MGHGAHSWRDADSSAARFVHCEAGVTASGSLWRDATPEPVLGSATVEGGDIRRLSPAIHSAR